MKSLLVIIALALAGCGTHQTRGGQMNVEAQNAEVPEWFTVIILVVLVLGLWKAIDVIWFIGGKFGDSLEGWFRHKNYFVQTPPSPPRERRHACNPKILPPPAGYEYQPDSLDVKYAVHEDRTVCWWHQAKPGALIILRPGEEIVHSKTLT